MKHSFLAILLGACLLATQMAAQTQAPAAADTLNSDRIEAARIPYVALGTDDATFAQIPRRMGPPVRPRPRAYPRGGYSNPWAQPGDGHRAVIGAIVGFGLGAAIGAKAASNQNATPGSTVAASFVIGGIGALLGAAVGYGTPPMPSRRYYRRRWAEEDESAKAGRKPAQRLQPQIASVAPHGTQVPID